MAPETTSTETFLFSERHFSTNPYHQAIHNSLSGSEASKTPSAISFRSGAEELSRQQRDYEARRRALERALEKVREKEVPGKGHAEAYLWYLYRKNCRAGTLKNNLVSLNLILDFLGKTGKARLEEITRDDLAAFVEHEQDRGLKVVSVKTRMGLVYAFLRFLAEREIVSPDVLLRKVRIKLPEALPRAMDPEDVKLLLSVIDRVRDRAMIVLLLRTGMRIGELLGATCGDLNLNERKIMIFEAQKTRVGRVVYFSDDARQALQAWLDERDPGREFLFYAQGRPTMTYNNARLVFKSYVNKADLDHRGYTLHCLRHTYASELLNAGMRLECLQQLLGHSSVEMTRRYARLTDKTREEEYFRAMSIIERGEIHGHYGLHRELSPVYEEEELLGSHREKLYERP